MALENLLVLTIMVFCISSISSVREQDISKHSHAEYRSEDVQQLNNSAGNTTRGFMLEDGSTGYTHMAGYQSKGAVGNTWWHGVRANMDVWQQDVQNLSHSAIYIAAINNYNGVEMIAAGVHTTKNMGCYNTYCPGFVIAHDANLFPGQALAPLSKYGGERRYITLRIKKDEKTGDWSLYREDKGGPIGGMTLLGWWPKTLFKELSDRANIIQWAGEVNYPHNETGPSMGSGHFPDEGKGKAAAFYDCFGFDYDGTIYRDSTYPIPFVDLPECYYISTWFQTSKPGYQHFFYGGPAGCAV